MESKTININDSVYALCACCPEIKDILADLGFKDILLPGMLNSVGRLMTLKKGAKLRGIDFALIEEKLKQASFVIED